MKNSTLIRIVYIIMRPILYSINQIGYFRVSKTIKNVCMQIKMEISFKKYGKMGRNGNIPLPNRIINPQYVFIGDNFSSLYGLRIEAWDSFQDQTHSPKIVIGNNVRMNTDCHIACINRIKIGNDVLIASRVFISDHFHGHTDGSDLEIAPALRELISKGAVEIGNNVWIGEGVSIMPGVAIGNNCIIGANSVVTKSFPGNSIIAGVPARLIKKMAPA
jgi:acetyltransferase-like isoleucine patch superfamily enzyme